MFKAVKECMRNWVMTHKRLYWYIVVGIAALAFGIITGMGCAKLERAEAAEQTIKATWNGEEVYIPLGNYPYYVVVRDKFGSGFDAVYLSFDKLEILSPNGSNGYYGIGIYDDSGNMDKSGNKLRMYGYDLKADILESYYDWYGFTFETYRIDSSRVISNYDVCDALTGEVIYESIIGYSSDSAYANFESLVIDNKLAQGSTTLGASDDLYTDYLVLSTWTYSGKLLNTTADDLQYKLNLDFVVELPTLEYVQGLYENFGYRSDRAVVVLQRNKELLTYWNSDSSADSRTFDISYSIDLVPDEQGRFTYSFTYLEWEYLLRACSSDLVAEFQNYDTHWRAILLSFMHVKQITSEVVTTRSESVVYGGFTTNRFERGVYDSCAEAYTKVDKDFVTSDMLEDMISDDIRIAEREYLKELEGRIEELEGQLGGMTSADNAFGDLEGSDLWTGFQSLVNGLASLAPSIRALSTLTGAVFAFMPLTITGIMSTTLFAICIIAIIKAIRG